MSSEQIEAATTKYPPSSIGVQQSEEMLRWIWDTGFAAVAGDMPAFETTPFQNAEYFLHEWLLAGWGVPIGELFDLERLAVECRRVKKWTFFFSSMPLHVSWTTPVSTVELTTLIGAWRCCKSSQWCCYPVNITPAVVGYLIRTYSEHIALLAHVLHSMKTHQGHFSLPRPTTRPPSNQPKHILPHAPLHSHRLAVLQLQPRHAPVPRNPLQLQSQLLI